MTVDWSSAEAWSSLGESLFGEAACNRLEKKQLDKQASNQTTFCNSNAFNHEKALKRIETLQKDGLSRSCSLAPVSGFLEEEMKRIGNKPLKCTSRTSNNCNAVDDTKQTSFLRKLNQQYPLQSTQSAEYVTLDKSSREKNVKRKFT